MIDHLALQVAEHLPRDLRATIVTHSLPVLTALAGRDGLELIAIGGRIMGDTLVAVGSASVDAYRDIHPDVCILGVAGIDVAAGLNPRLEIGMPDGQQGVALDDQYRGGHVRRKAGPRQDIRHGLKLLQAAQRSVALIRKAGGIAGEQIERHNDTSP